MSQDPPVHKRRVRYKGKNPRRFEDRYKELDPTKYPEQLQHVKAKGLTPAGTHRPICVDEILDVLRPQAGEVALDATLGYGGHSRELLRRLLPQGRLFAVDVDPLEMPKTEARLRAEGFGEDAFVARQMSFSGVRSLLHEAGGGFDCILADLGVSSMQLDNPVRGFTYKANGPLDLRLNPRKGKPVSEMLKSWSVEKLESMLFEYADEPHAEAIAVAIKCRREPIETTAQLADTVKTGLSMMRTKLNDNAIKKSLQRTFMALRIAVNEELSVLDHFLQIVPHCLNPGGRVAILSFHSGEDRRVKKAFSIGLQSALYCEVATSPITPSAAECRDNPRASCAKLRWAVRSET